MQSKVELSKAGSQIGAKLTSLPVVVDWHVDYLRAHDMQGYRASEIHSLLSKSDLKSMFGQQDYTFLHTERNWIWIFDSANTHGLKIDPSIQLDLLVSKRGAHFRAIRKDGQKFNPDDIMAQTLVLNALKQITALMLSRAPPEVLAQVNRI